MKQIVAVRVALVMRSTNKEKDIVSPASLALFDGFVDASSKSLARTVTLSATDDQFYRYRVVEFTIPLRNMLLLP
jgi:type IV pilus assembly protein PilW